MTHTVFSAAQVQEHRTAKSVWITYKGKVYDVTNFISDHPGGADLILQHGGTDVEEIMKDNDSHRHSEAAYEMLQEYCIGVLDNINDAISSLSKTTEEVQKGVALGYAKKSDKFIDTNRPMLAQVFYAKWTKDFYVEQVHLPRQVKGSAPIFGNFLEILSLTPWYVIPIVYIPVVLAHLYYAIFVLGVQTVFVPLYFAFGLFVWTFVEYSLHRMRLVMPPALGLTLSIPVRAAILVLFPKDVSFAVIAGAYCGFMLYDLVHYHLHHARPFSAHLREMKTYHLDHHYKNANLGFGITSKFWDYVFKTELK
ncbi:fatty acid alpha-hydroxylase [Entophlyctis luteolus]|nr:fatty acid alpha-hydroxylase [Entophlyctis luteolus]